MNNRSAIIAMLAVLCVLGARSATSQQPAPAAPPAASPPNAAPAPVPYAMTMGDMMNTLVQPRHAKLGLAGHAENWALADYALAEIREAFAGIANAKPRFRGLPVAELADAALSPADRGPRCRDQAEGRAKIRHRLRSAHAGLQRLPRGGRSSFRRHQAARCLGLCQPGFQPAALDSLVARPAAVA